MFLICLMTGDTSASIFVVLERPNYAAISPLAIAFFII